MVIANSAYSHERRPQWTEKQAREWQTKVGVLKGFNEPEVSYPGMSRKEVFKKASELGFNCVRFFIKAKTVDEQIKYIRDMADEACACGLKISPVLLISNYYSKKYKEKAFEQAKEYTHRIIGAFAKDKRIVLWDIWNEPGYDDGANLQDEMKWLKAAVFWCRDMSPVQPITSSIFCETNTELNPIDFKTRAEVEKMMDVHNFHDYYCASEHMKRIESFVKRLQKISDRPLVCTECITRTNGSDIFRSLVSFSEYHVNFFMWGLYICDYNWGVKWWRSTYRPYEPIFHDLLHPDGEPYDRRELDWLKNFHFALKNENVDPGAELTERWDKARAWKWMVDGPVKGFSCTLNKTCDWSSIKNKCYNGLRIQCNFNEWKKDSASFYKGIDSSLYLAGKLNMRIIPSLLTDNCVGEKDTVLADYIAHTIRRYGNDPHIQAWEIYAYPGIKEKDTSKLIKLLRLLFNYARFEFPNQPLTATPYVSVKDFDVSFDYAGALVHGHYNGWNYMVCKGGSTPELCNLIWRLSDVISFSCKQSAMESGWITSLAYRYGRPLICTEWSPPEEKDIAPTLNIFAKSHVFWYCLKDIDKKYIDAFNFEPIITAK